MKKRTWIPTLIAALLCGVALLGGCSEADPAAGGASLAETGSMILRVNPEIAITYNKQGLVTGLTGGNDDGTAIVAPYTDYIGKHCKAVLRDLIGRIRDAGYFVSDADGSFRNITVQFEPGSVLPQPDFPAAIAEDIRNTVKEMDLGSAVVGIAPADYQTDDSAGSTSITADKAKEIALAHAMLEPAAVTYTKVKLDRDDGRLIWDLEFYGGEREYDYEIDAGSGRIVDVDWDTKDDGKRPATTAAAPAPSSPASTAASSATTAAYITRDKAVEIALNHAGVKKADARFDDVEFDRDDGRPMYEIEFDTATHEYEYDIHAVTGAILKHEAKERRTKATATAASNASSAYITRDKAIQIALDHAGVKKADARFDDVEFEWDDGRPEYKVEFSAGNKEYEYEIDAVTGKILDVEIDEDDDDDD